jgi:nuclear pore complex protein Nup62
MSLVSIAQSSDSLGLGGTSQTSSSLGTTLLTSTTIANNSKDLRQTTVSASSASNVMSLNATNISSTSVTTSIPKTSSAISTSRTSGTLQGISQGLTTVSGGKGAADKVKKYTYRELQELVANWTSELEENEKLFLKQAQQMSEWDKTLTLNAEGIINIHSDLDSVKSDQNKLEKELDLILAQQKDIEELLRPLEEQASYRQSSTQQKADVERERIYSLAESLDQQMQQMEQSLAEIIEHINSASGERDPNAPIAQIARILNAHASSLQWIERNAGVLGHQLERIS